MKKKRNDELVCGVWPVTEAIRSGKHIDHILMRRDRGGDALRDLRAEAEQAGIPVKRAPVEKLDRTTHAEHQGVIAFVSPLPVQDIDEIIIMAYERGETPLVIMLDGVTDVRNLGAIARSAECLGAHALLVPLQGSARMGADAIKSSAGALMRIPVCREPDLEASLPRLHAHGLGSVAITEKGDRHLQDVDLQGPLVLIVGSESTGISDGLVRKAEILASIPMLGSISSLNVSVASGITLYEVARQRGKK